MRVSVIVSTYNQPVWLEKVLWGYAAQSYRDFDLVIADDGSGPETAAVIERFKAENVLDVTHVWHADRGFRKCEILNRAVLSTQSEYLIFTDGDCVPRNDFVATHAELAEPGRFLSGGALRLSGEASDRLTRDDIISGRFATASWLRRHGYCPGTRRLRLFRAKRLTAAVDALTTTPAHFDGGNASVWKAAVLQVNGFDTEMGYGWEDRALGHRLRHVGYRGKQIRHRAICFHLEHDRPYKSEAELKRNREIYDRVIRNRETRARAGIAELLAEAKQQTASPQQSSCASP